MKTPSSPPVVAVVRAVVARVVPVAIAVAIDMVREVGGPIEAIIGAWDFNSSDPYRREIPVSHIAIMPRTILPLVKR